MSWKGLKPFVAEEQLLSFAFTNCGLSSPEFSDECWEDRAWFAPLLVMGLWASQQPTDAGGTYLDYCSPASDGREHLGAAKTYSPPFCALKKVTWSLENTTCISVTTTGQVALDDLFLTSHA